MYQPGLASTRIVKVTIRQFTVFESSSRGCVNNVTSTSNGLLAKQSRRRIIYISSISPTPSSRNDGSIRTIFFQKICDRHEVLLLPLNK